MDVDTHQCTADLEAEAAEGAGVDAGQPHLRDLQRVGVARQHDVLPLVPRLESKIKQAV